MVNGRRSGAARGAFVVKWFSRLCAITFGLLLAAVLVELLARGLERIERRGDTGRDFEGSVFEFSASLHHRLIPNGRYRHSSYEFDYLWANNSLGMRDRPHPLHKQAGTFRILFLGDSFIQGHGVRLEDVLARRLEASLNLPPRRETIEVLNGGVFGYSPFLEYLYLREIIEDVEPDLVIVGFFLGNDVGEDYFYTHEVHVSTGVPSFDDHEWPWSLIVEALDRGGEVQPAGKVVASRNGSLWSRVKAVLRRSRALTLLKSRIEIFVYPRRREREFALVAKHRGDVRYDLGLVNYPVLSESDRLSYWKTPEKYLEKIATLCRERHARMVLLVIPPVERLKGETRFEEPYRILDELGRRLGVPVVNLLPDFLGESPDALYYEFDRHWTAEGHARAAQALDRELRELRMLPDREPSFR